MTLVGTGAAVHAVGAAEETPTTELQEVVVTAERKTEKLQDVPIAITAVSASDLIDRGVRQASDITALVPNMLLNLPYGPEGTTDLHATRRDDT